MGMFASIWGMMTILYTTSAAPKLTTFTGTTSKYLGATAIDSPRASNSVLACIRTCHTEYIDCFSVTYNRKTGDCTPRAEVRQEFIRSRTADELFYYTNICNKVLGFSTFVQESVILCLFVSTKTENFDSARRICQGKGSSLYIIESKEKLSILRRVIKYITRSKTWIGLTDRTTEGTFVWENKVIASNDTFPVPWRYSQPDNSFGMEDCAEIGSSDDFMFINDSKCWESGNFICEMDTFS